MTKEKCKAFSRRKLLKLGGAGLGIMTLGPLARMTRRSQLSADPLLNHKRLIIVNMFGGNDGLNTVVPISNNRYYERREGLAIAQANTLPLSGSSTYALNGQLDRIQGLWDEGSAAIINGVGYPDANLSHFVSEDIWSHGTRHAQKGSESGWVARFADLNTDSAMGVVGVGVGKRKDFLGTPALPFVVGRLSRFRFNRDNAHRNDHDYRIAKVRRILEIGAAQGLQADVSLVESQALELQDQIQEALDSFTEVAVYSEQRFSQRTRDISVLIQGGFETRLFYAGLGGFDTHSGQAGRHDELMQELDDGIGSLVDDLKAMGVWNDSVIVIISEFGRRNYVNGSDGTDHGHGNCVFVLGGSVNGGLYGPDIDEADMDLEFLDYGVDFRTVYSQLLANHLGVDPDPVFPEPPEIPDSPGTLTA